MVFRPHRKDEWNKNGIVFQLRKGIPMENELKEQLSRIIDGKYIRTVFQPVVSLRDGSVLGYEALSRMTCETAIQNPEQLFQLASESDRLWDLELLCRTTALQAAFQKDSVGTGIKLFLNVNPNIMHDEKFQRGFTREYLQRYGALPENVIFEITERNAVENMAEFCGTVEHYKNQNYHIAIDDVGSGFSGLNMISDLHPHFIKLDMNLIRNINKDAMRIALVKSLADFSKTTNVALIAEGVETREELMTLIEIGVQYAQGYFLRRPNPEFADIDERTRGLIVELNRRRNQVYGNQVDNIYIANICTSTETLPPEMKVVKAFEKLKQDPDSFGFCVVKDGAVLGIITKANLILQLSGQYGFSLNQKKPVSVLMDPNFMSVDYQMPISAVSNLAMQRQMDKLYDFIVVTKHDKYFGTVTIKDLLQRTTEIEVMNAKFQNPLTGLPGNVVIEQKISHCIASMQPYSVLYFDMDNFKAYNDAYGFEKGDCIIKLLASCMTSHLPKGQFVGHVGGDDFVAVLTNGEEEKYCDEVISEFACGVVQYYKEEDVQRGYIVSKNRHGDVERFPMVSLSVAGICDRDHRFSCLDKLMEELAEVKTQSKMQKGNSCCLRR